MILLDNQNTSTHIHSLHFFEHHTVYTQDVFLLTGGNLSGTFLFNRHLGGEFIKWVPTDADVGNCGW
jgi:hypothetical protein